MAKVELDELRIKYAVYDSENGSESVDSFFKFQGALNYVEKECSPGSWICIQFYDKKDNLLKKEVIYETSFALPFSMFGD